MALTSLYQYNTGGIQFSLYGYASVAGNPVNFCFLWLGAPPVNDPELKDTWQQNGLYTFFPPATDYQWADVGASLYALFQQQKIYGIRFAWVTQIGVQLVSSIYVSNGIVTAFSNLLFRQFQLLISIVHPTISLNPAKDGFIIDHTCVMLLPDAFDPTSQPIALSTDMEIRVASQEMGTFRFSVSPTGSQLTDCHAGLHYYHSIVTPGNPNQPDYPYYFTFDYPVLNPAATLPLQVSLDILAPDNPLRSFFSIIGNDTIHSNIPTYTGHFVSLQPVATVYAGGNGFSFLNYPKAAQQTGLYCLSLQGSFVMSLENDVSQDAASNESQLLCGLSGTEHIAFIPLSKDYPGDLIDFVPGNLAFAPVFPLLKQTQDNSKSTPELVPNAFCSTSWVQIRKNTPLPPVSTINYYYCQPEDAALFKPDSSAIFLDIFDAEAGNTFDGTQPSPIPKCFPLVPYAQADKAVDGTSYPSSIADFEYQILNPLRKSTIVTKLDIAAREAVYAAYRKRLATDPSLAGEDHFTTTPQGLLVQVDTSATIQKWVSLVLATNQDAKVAANALLRLENVNATIQSAFQTNQQFLVVSQKGSLGSLSDASGDNQTIFHNTISIAGWPFHIDIGTNDFGDFSNVMLCKFCSGSIVERVQNTQSWTQPEDFVGTDTNAQDMLSRWLLNYCKNIDAQHQANNPSFDNIYQIIHDVNWNGIIALNVDIGLSDFPEDIKGLLGGIDTSRFKAHHFGIEINHITITGGIVTNPASSSLFGLIDYTDPGYINEQEPPGPTNVDYDFKVLKLLVVFKNSAIVDFKSKLQLTINTLFGDQVVNTQGQGGQFNTILLDGSYENHNGQNTYIFNETGDQLFTINNNVLQVVEILKVQFTTLSTDQSSDDVRSRFSIWGNLHFASLPGIDAFSFDHLSFSNLGIKMDFSDLNPSVRNFSFDPQAMGFDIVSSTGRLQSFALNYPLAISGLLYSDGNQMPKDLGYLSVGSPLDDKSKMIGKSWYALSFNLNLGTMGALGSKLGLTASIALVWGAGLINQQPTDFAAAVFIRLPGTGGSSSFFSLQNVLKLTISSIKLFVDADITSGNAAYLITFNNIALKVLSKQLPTKGKIGMYLFGDPNQHGVITSDPSQTSLGWYAAYQKDK